MNVKDLKGQKIAFAGSGGLDSCTIIRWLTDNGVKVVCLTVDLAQPDEDNIDDIRKRMVAAGAEEHVLINAKEAIAEAGLKVIQAQATYEGGYWNTTGIARHVKVEAMIPELRKRGITILSHGATGRGNDQVRFQLGTNMLAPDIQVYAPWRDEIFLEKFRGRQEMIAFCEERGLPVKATKDKPYSTDANLLGLTHEAGILESLETPASVITAGFGNHSTAAPDKPEQITVRFEKGRPVEIDGKKLDVFGAFQEANKRAGVHGVGIGVHVTENRFVGIKSRGIYEMPGMELLGKSYEYLLQLVIDRRARELFDTLSRTVSKQIYQGYFFDLASNMAMSAIAKISELITGTVTVQLYKGTISFVAIKDVPHSLYSEDDASMEAVGSYDHQDTEGFLRVLGVSARSLAIRKQSGSTLKD
jgi:argininosuccinate synthase